MEPLWIVLALFVVTIGLVFRVIDRDRHQQAAARVEKLRLDQLDADISAALLPEPGQSTGDLNRDIAFGAQLILDHLHAIQVRDGSPKSDEPFRMELRIDDLNAMHRKIARRAMATFDGLNLARPNAISIRDREVALDGSYLIHADLVMALTRLRARMLLSTVPVAKIGLEQRNELGDNGKASDIPVLVRASIAAQPLGSIEPPVVATSPCDDLRSGAMPPLSQPTADPTLVAASAASPREFVEHFAREMGQQEATIEYLLRHAGKVDVEHLWTALDLVLRKDDAGLRRPLMKAMKSIERSIDDARAHVPPQLITEPGAVADLNDFADRLKSMTVVMVMLPGAAYDNIINQMEAELAADRGAGRLTTVMAEKHRVLVRHRSELAKAEYSEDHWDAILQSLMKFHAGLDQIAVDRPPTSMA